MASLFRARREAPEEGGSGGKILRDRRGGREAQPSPYARPPPLALPPPPPPAGSPRWLLGLVSGAGKLISSAFRSDGSSPDSSASSSSSSTNYSPRSDEEGNVDAPKMLTGPKQGLDNSDVIADYVEGSRAIVPISETKLAIQKLLSQETFSRDECERLTKLLQSRVVDSPSANRVLGNIVHSPQPWLSSKQSPNLIGSVPYSPGDSSPKTPAFGASVVHNAAIMEAKKWLEEKKLTSKSKVDLDVEPCTLNTNMLHCDAHDDVSPVDLAKSYMQSLPPCQSPSFDTSTLKSTTDSRVNLFPDRSNQATSTNSLSSFKEFKRKYLSARLWESPDDTSNKKPRLADTWLESCSFKQIDSRELFQRKTSKISSAANERDHDFLRTMQFSSSLSSMENVSAPAKSLTEHVENLCSKDVRNLVDKTYYANPSTLPLTDKSTSTTFTSEPKKILKEVVAPKEIALSMPTVNTLDSTVSDGPTGTNLYIYLDANQDVSNLSTVQEDIVENNVPRESFISASTSMVPGGDSRYPTPHIEKVIETPDRDVDDATYLKNMVHASSANKTTSGVIKANNSTELNLDSESNLHDMVTCSLHGIDGLANEFNTNGGSSESNPNPQPVCQVNESATQCSNGDQTAITTEATIYVPPTVNPPVAQETDNTATKSQNGTTFKSMERILIEPQPSSRNPKKRAIVKVGRGRGRGRGRGPK
ncbi:uncharacterized protein LOC122019733 isoform X1 [Zingiber officinale]|uniref:uncharacterized protein LOC122019733 isoform X1 n=1 Tax=Zingiber officinale TaxID=94328 RepID=UPI001C4B4175|nr:uncharacterized protein LOC122019733 isoform X1 [Zingiber officinale]